MYKWIICSLLLVVCFQSEAQQPIISPAIQDLMKKAVDQMNDRKYEEANVTFREMLASKKVLPTNMSFFFAETLYMINQYHNSENFLNKYLDLAGKGGDYYTEATELQRLLTSRKDEIKTCNYCNVFGYRLDSCKLCEGKGSLVSTCYYCKGIGKTSCKTCQGDGVIVTKNIFDVAEYKSCHVCNTKGYHACKVCHGSKIVNNQCPDCLGSKFIASKIICDHKPGDAEHIHEEDNENN